MAALVGYSFRVRVRVVDLDADFHRGGHVDRRVSAEANVGDLLEVTSHDPVQVVGVLSAYTQPTTIRWRTPANLPWRATRRGELSHRPWFGRAKQPPAPMGRRAAVMGA